MYAALSVSVRHILRAYWNIPVSGGRCTELSGRAMVGRARWEAMEMRERFRLGRHAELDAGAATRQYGHML